VDRYYKHSGKFSPLGVALGLLAGTVVSIPAAFAYNYGIFSIPEARLRVLCTLAYGALVGAASGVAMCWGKVRSKAVAGLISFGADIYEHFRVAGSYTARILKGAQPADLPVQVPTKFDLMINRKTAQALGLTVPPTLRGIVPDVLE